MDSYEASSVVPIIVLFVKVSKILGSDAPWSTNFNVVKIYISKYASKADVAAAKNHLWSWIFNICEDRTSIECASPNYYQQQ